MSAAAPISLTIVHEVDAGHSLTFLASDGRGHFQHHRLALADAALQPWRQAPADPAAQRAFGAGLAQALLPGPVRQFLADQADALLLLVLPESLLDLPWELAVVDAAGEQLLDERHLVQRLLLGLPPAAAPGARRAPGQRLPVLCVGAAEAAWPAPAEAGSAPPGRWADAAAQAELLHLGAAALAADAGPWLAAVQALAPSPGLLLLEGAHAHQPGWRRAGLQAGLAVLALPELGPPALLSADPAAAPHPATSAFVQDLMQALAQGQGWARAAQTARTLARRRACPAGQAWFYGDGQAVPLAPAAARQPDDDVRQLTMLACDLVDSTRMMGRLGDEEYSERLARYHARVAQVVRAHGGVSDDPQGDDGFMCYFGFPVASEGSAAQAVRAGLALAGALADLQWQLRIGISTGRVVIRNGQPVGSAVHHAARLQSVAQPDTVLVSDTTRTLSAERFVYLPVLDAPPLKGFDDSGPLWRALNERPALGTERFDTRSRLSAFVGRDAEMQALRQRWQAAVDSGQRQALLLAGEAGIGKSRLVREFRRQLLVQGHRALECRCGPEHSGSALQPVIDLLQRQLQWHELPDAAERQQRLRVLLASAGQVDTDSVALLGALLGLPRAQLPPLPELSPERQRQRTMAALLGWLMGLAAAGPVCLIFEDVHWLDPSTRELIGHLVTGQAPARLLLLLTLRGRDDVVARAGFEVPLLPLAGLPTDAACALLQGAYGAALLDADQVRWLAERADGVPLFIEESARMAATLAERPVDGAELAARLREAVPATLQDLLMARLDQLPSAKPVAQLGGAIGRAFSLALLVAVNAHAESPIQLAQLDTELQRLVQAGLIEPQGSDEHRLYVFKHALVRDAAYQSLLERDRRRLHASIATVMRAQFPALVAQQPELLAQHLEWAGQIAEALAAWERAARFAAQRSAHDEAIAHLQHALALLARQDAHAERDRMELRLQLLLASRFIATQGYGADRVEAVYNRALVLAQALGDAGSLTKARLGLEGWHFMRGNFAQAHAIARDVAASLGPTPEPLAQIQSTWALANIIFHQGEVTQAVLLMDQCLAAYQRLGHRPGAVQDPGVMCLCYSSWALWELGAADQALQRARRVVDLAEGLNHPFSIGEAHGFLAVAHYFRGETEPGLRAAKRAIEVCEAGGFAVWLAHAKVVHGRLVAQAGDIEAGLEEMRQGDAMWAATGAVVTRPFYTVLRAEGLALAGRPDEALALLDEAWALVQRFGERYYEPELRRCIGELTLRSSQRGGAAAAEPWLQGALDSARAIGLRGLALRAACSLGRLWAAQGRPVQAAALVAGELRGLSEGRGTRDLREAQALLADWQHAAG